jgi:hypothetical protein
LAQQFEMEQEVEQDAEESDVSCSFSTAGGEQAEEEDMPMELGNTDIPSLVPGLPSLVPGLPPPENNAAPSQINPNFSLDEICTYELITLLDNAGAPRNCYERLVALLRKQTKKGFKVANAISRDVFLRKMQEKFNCPTLLTSIVSDCTVFRFPFTEMLQDLINSRKNEIHLFNGTPEPGDELWNTSWMQETFAQQYDQGRDFDPAKDIMVPIVLYMDKTGTDAYQRYTLEPVLFTTGVISKEMREDRRSWRHLGFIPSALSSQHAYHRKSWHNCAGGALVGLPSQMNLSNAPPSWRCLCFYHSTLAYFRNS